MTAQHHGRPSALRPRCLWPDCIRRSSEDGYCAKHASMDRGADPPSSAVPRAPRPVPAMMRLRSTFGNMFAATMLLCRLCHLGLRWRLNQVLQAHKHHLLPLFTELSITIRIHFVQMILPTHVLPSFIYTMLPLSGLAAINTLKLHPTGQGHCEQTNRLQVPL
ncbi:unnamed protein product [Cladocopium goreaui]|uniref:Uncharacterized protein n=1 Tax=Cladocopium goreaui TaxID=2562237 RepID=A0A9P1GDP8_9DINO|nr:unnamed protein product [Cladocopium goreaui]